MNRILLIILLLCSINICQSRAQSINGVYTTEWQWNMKQKTNWVNQLRLDMSLPLGKGNNSIEAATLHVAKTDDTIIDDWQGFSNIEADNMFAAIAVLGFMHEWKSGHVFFGVRNVNEDFFTSDVTSLFLNGSEGIFPTIAASYPIANYPLSGLTIYFDVTRGAWTFRNSLYNGVGYNGWKRRDNPFLVRPKKDGIFNISQLEYSHGGSHFFAGAAVHNRNHTSCAWWIYGEQTVWAAADRSIACMAQYSENTGRDNGCRRYAEAGCAYTDSSNECGLSAQYVRFNQGAECSVELTWRRQLSKTIALQPSFQYINNDNGDFAVVSARMSVSF